jgi:hypothetical protein
VKFLVDQNRSRPLNCSAKAADAVHTTERGLEREDDVILEHLDDSPTISPAR